MSLELNRLQHIDFINMVKQNSLMEMRSSRVLLFYKAYLLLFKAVLKTYLILKLKFSAVVLWVIFKAGLCINLKSDLQMLQ